MHSRSTSATSNRGTYVCVYARTQPISREELPEVICNNTCTHNCTPAHTRTQSTDTGEVYGSANCLTPSPHTYTYTYTRIHPNLPTQEEFAEVVCRRFHSADGRVHLRENLQRWRDMHPTSGDARYSAVTPYTRGMYVETVDKLLQMLGED